MAGCSLGRVPLVTSTIPNWPSTSRPSGARPPEETVDRIQQAVAEYDAKALKIKVGYLMFMTTDMNAKEPGGKTERLIPLLREIYGPDMALYADANGYYDVNEAIRVGKLLEENKYAYFEEPVMFDDFEAIKKVADALSIPIANGEQDQSFVNFRWLIANDGIEIVQPDSYYFGGLIRSRKGRADGGAFGKSIVPHMSGGGLGFVYNSHLVSVLPNAGAHHEAHIVPFCLQFEPPGRIRNPLAAIIPAVYARACATPHLADPLVGVHFDPVEVHRQHRFFEPLAVLKPRGAKRDIVRIPFPDAAVGVVGGLGFVDHRSPCMLVRSPSSTWISYRFCKYTPLLPPGFITRNSMCSRKSR